MALLDEEDFVPDSGEDSGPEEQDGCDLDDKQESLSSLPSGAAETVKNDEEMHVEASVDQTRVKDSQTAGMAPPEQQAENVARDELIDTSASGATTAEDVVAPPEDDGWVDATDSDEIREGSLVVVQSRTWPGINKLGGAGKVTAVHREIDANGKEVRFYDVRYVMGGFEKRIEEEFVKLSDLLQRQAVPRESIPRKYYYLEFPAKPRQKKVTAEPQPPGSLPTTSLADGGIQHPAKSAKKRKRTKPSQPKQPQAGVEENPPTDENTGSDGDQDSSEDEVLVRRVGGILVVPNDDITDDKETDVEEDASVRAASEESYRITQQAESSNSELDFRLTTSNDREEGRPILSSDEVSSNKPPRRGRKRRRPKRATYVGGYDHGGDGEDGNFIQPEDNAASLPEDVQEKINFKLGKTKVELKQQFVERSEMFAANLALFEKRKLDMDSRLTNVAALNQEELDRLYSEPGVQELVHDQRKQQANSFNSWIKNAQNRVQAMYARKGYLAPSSGQKQDHDPSAEESSSESEEESDRPVNRKTSYADKPRSRKQASEPGRVKRRKRHTSVFPSVSRHDDVTPVVDSWDSMKIPEPRAPRAPNRKKRTMSTSLDDYGYVRNGVSQSSREELSKMSTRSRIHFSSRKSSARDQDVWDWLRLAQLKRRQKARSTERSDSMLHRAHNVGSQNHLHTARNQKKTPSVQDERFRLRNKRHQDDDTSTVRRHPPQLKQNGTVVDWEIPITSSYPGDVTESAAKPLLSASIVARQLPTEASVSPKTSIEAQQAPTMKKPEARVDWEAVGSILQKQEHAAFLACGVSVEYRERLASFGHTLASAHIWCQQNTCIGPDVDFITAQCASLRQQLNDLRVAEAAFVGNVARNRYVDLLQPSVLSEYQDLHVCAETYHLGMTRFIALVMDGLSSCAPTRRETLARLCLKEVATSVSMLPDCSSLFSDCSAYIYFFEVAADNATTTPTISAIVYTYWYFVQLVFAFQSGLHDPRSGQLLVRDVEHDTLPPNLLALATVLFLVDLFLYLPSSQRVNQEQDGEMVAAPALSLWQLLHDTLSGKAIQSQVNQPTPEKFWALLTVAYDEKYVDEVTWHFLNGETSGGYIRRHVPALRLDEHNEEHLECQLLALDCMWDLVVIVADLVDSPDGYCVMSMPLRSNVTLTPSTHRTMCWDFIKHIIQPNKHDWLPYGSTASCSVSFQSHTDLYRNRALCRLLRLSYIWKPSSDIVELCLNKAWVSTSSDKTSRLPQFLSAIPLETDFTQQSAIDLVVSGKVDGSSTVELLCQLIFLQVVKLEKPIHRNRFRSALLRSITQRLADTTAKDPDTTSANKSQPASKWDWGSSNTKHAQAVVKIEPRKPTSSTDRSGEACVMLSVLFTLAQVTFRLNSSQPGQTTRTNKVLNREVEFYCTEAIRVARQDAPVVLADFLYSVGIMAITKTTAYAVPFAHFNEVLGSTAKQCIEMETKKAATAEGGKNATAQNINASNASKKNGSAAADKSPSPIQRALVQVVKMELDLVHHLLVRANDSCWAGGSTDAIRECVANIVSSGLALCFEAVVDKMVSAKLLVEVLGVLRLLHPLPQYQQRGKSIVDDYIRRSNPPSIPVLPVSDEFDEFDDPSILSALMAVDLDTISASQALTQRSSSVVTQLEPSVNYAEIAKEIALDCVVRNLRVSFQRLVINYPGRTSIWSGSFEESYATELLGAAISTCQFNFPWHACSPGAQKARFLGPRLFSAILKYNSDKEWFSTCFLSDPTADQDLVTLWLMSTLDMDALFENTYYPAIKTPAMVHSTDSPSPSLRYADYWLSLTDSLTYELLRPNDVVQHKMDATMLQLLRAMAVKWSPIIAPAFDGLISDTRLYEYHLQAFQVFCCCVNETWESLNRSPTTDRELKYRFRSKLLDGKRGAFIAVTESYEIRLKKLWELLSNQKLNWFEMTAGFQNDVVGGDKAGSFHNFDESTRVLEGLPKQGGTRYLIVFFRFMYSCIDAFLFHCGRMAIGQRNVFFNIMGLMFRQSTSAEYTQANARLQDKQTGARDWNGFGDLSTRQESENVLKPQSDHEKGCLVFFENVRVFFACQRYPSLLHWFAQTIDIYQTLNDGWTGSPLRTLLLNILDPDGPLGIHSYYPLQETDQSAEQEGSCIRREAYYVSCGLMVCKCTASYQHSVSPLSNEALANVDRLRRFILNDFMRETFLFAATSETAFDETLLPTLQLLKAFLHHCVVNIEASPTAVSSYLNDALPALVSAGKYIITTLDFARLSAEALK
ncbi:TPA: hypothetical protein N0F65_011680 [Lagenidium giganteum]|uniref:Uncharacterized protein n=1 Tax=Lagenidium giganteum TaxID=4803 RepID=A0AAV2ZAK0_9STRA|nr:TPA: hypothetical protein N0F65_011680 [Lagenidium giganteum]